MKDDCRIVKIFILTLINMAKKGSKKKANSIPKHLIIFGTLLILMAIIFVILIITQNTPNTPTTNEINNLQKTSNNEQTKNVNSAREEANNMGIFNPLTDSIETVSDLNNAIATTCLLYTSPEP